MALDEVENYLVNFISSDRVTFKVSIKSASKCLALTGKIEEGAVINLPEISSETFAKIHEWLEHWIDEPLESEDLKESLNNPWNKTFIESLSHDESVKLVSALCEEILGKIIFFYL